MSPCRNPATEPLLHHSRVNSGKPPSRGRGYHSPRHAFDGQPLPPSERPAAPALEADRGASRNLKHSDTGSRRPPVASCDPLAVSRPRLHSSSVGFRRFGVPHPPLQPPASSLRNHTTARRTHPFAPVAPLSGSIGSIGASAPRATPLFRLPAASSHFTLFPSASTHPLIRRVTRAISALSIRREHWKGRSSIETKNTHFVVHTQKQEGQRFRCPSLFDPFVDPTLTPQSRVAVGSIRPNTASPNCFTAKTAMKKALTGMAR